MSTALPWDQARRVAAAAASPLAPVAVRLDAALGCALANPISALTDLPAFDTAAMDGYAVSGPGPWTLAESDFRAGSEMLTRLDPGSAAAIATGAALPSGCDAVLRSELARVETALHGARLYALDPLTGLPDDGGTPLPPGTDVRPRGEECAEGEPLVPAGSVVTPAMLGLAAAAGYDSLDVIPPPTVAVLVLGDELLDRGLPRPGRVRDALSPLVPPWLADLGARANPPIRVPDTRQALLDEIEDSTADVIVTTGSTASGPVDFVHDVLDHLGARWVVDGVQVRPGHPMLLAVLPDGRPIVGLPGNPLAAVSGLVTLAAPLIAAMRDVPSLDEDVVLGVDVTSHPRDTRIIPVVIEDGQARPLRFDGPAMLRSLALADALVAIPPSGGLAGSAVPLLPVPALR
ncbi:MAG: molybdopterin molybdotransferase MoeA [Candidatus Nanopelagicales bacterium]